MSIQQKKNLQHFWMLFRRPSFFVEKFLKKLMAWRDSFFIAPVTRCFIAHNRHVWKGWVDPSARKVILVEWQDIPMWHIQGLMFANILARKKQARIATFSRTPQPFARSARAVHASLNVAEHLAMQELSGEQRNRRDRLYDEYVTSLKRKEDVYHLHIHGVHLGLDIYETYLREFNKPTVVIDEDLLVVVRYGIGLLVFWEDYFEANPVAAVLILHDCYLDHNVAARIAYQRQVPVYMPNGNGIALLKKPYDTRDYFYSYKGWFSLMTEEEKCVAREWAKGRLQKRLSGEKLEEMYYAVGTPFNPQHSFTRVLRESDKLKVLICTHCFYDSPNSYGGMLFIDFYEWLRYLTDMARKTDYDWYLKTHPRPLPGTIETIRKILGPDSNITILPSTTSHQQLVHEGIDRILTVYGSVGHEYPVFGVQVVNGGYNPHAAYDFTWTPATKAQYENFLLNLASLKKEIDLNEVYEFYYMHYNYACMDDLFLDSFRTLLFKTQGRSRLDVYAAYLAAFSHRHEDTVHRIEEFIDSGKDYLFSKGPVNKYATRPVDADYLS